MHAFIHMSDGYIPIASNISVATQDIDKWLASLVRQRLWGTTLVVDHTAA
jgi:hypothetical protein